MKNRLNKKARGNRRIFGAFGVLILAALFLSSSYFFEYSFAQTHPFLKYFPANEEIITYSTDGFSGYPLALTEITSTGTYTIVYSVSDTAGNTSNVTKTLYMIV